MADTTVAVPETPAPAVDPSFAAVEQGDFAAFEAAERARARGETPPPVADVKPAASSTAEPLAPESAPGEPDKQVPEVPITAVPETEFQKATARKAELNAEIRALIQLRDSMQRGIATPERTDVKPAASSPATPVVADPSDPEPTFESFSKAHPDHPDPYAGFLREQGKWDRRQETRAAAEYHRDQSVLRARQEAAQTFHERAEIFAKEHVDFEPVTAALIQRNDQHPFGLAISQALMDTPNGEAVFYKLATDPALEAKVFRAKSPVAALVEVGVIAASLSAAPAPQLKTVSTSSPPPTVLGRKPAAPADEALAAVAAGDFRAFEAAENAKARAAREQSAHRR